MDACDRVQSMNLLSPMMGPSFMLIEITRLIVSELKHHYVKPCEVICYIPIYADDATLYSICNQTSDLWQQLKLASELEFALQDTVNWGRKWLVDFSTGKTQLVSFNQSNNTGAIDVKINESVHEEK